MNKKVIFVSNVLSHGGAGRVMSIIINNFAQKGMEVKLCSFLNDYETYPIDESVENILIKSNEKNKLVNGLIRLKKLRKVFKENKGATIIAFETFINIYAIIANLFLGNKIIVSERCNPLYYDRSFIRKYSRRFLYNKIDVLVCQTEQAKNYFPTSIQKKSVVISNPIMNNLPDKFTGERKKEIVTFGRITKQKNLKMLIDAFVLITKEDKYADFVLKLYGDGSELNRLKRYAEELGISNRVKFLGFISNIHTEILESYMFVSSSNYEGISNSMLEAMGIGLPTICTDCPVGGASMIIDNNENGILIPVGDVNALYRAMKKLIDETKVAEKLSNNAVKIKDELNEKHICEMWENLL